MTLFVGFGFFVYETQDYLTHYCMWNAIVTALYCAFAAFSSKEMIKRRGRDHDLLQSSFSLYHIALVGNCISTIVFWSTNWKEDLMKFNDLFSTVFSAVFHTLPCIVVLGDLLLTKVSICEKQFTNLVVYNGAYLVVNAVYSYLQGPIYSYLNWTDSKSYTILLLIIILPSCVFFVLSNLTEGRIGYRKQKEE